MFSYWIILVPILWSSGPGLQSACGLKYSDLLSLNISCAPKDTCERRLFKSRDLTSFTDRNCACDDACTAFGDCCIDAPARTATSTPPSIETKGLVCKGLTQFGGIIMKNECANNWNGSSKVRNKCEDESEYSEADPLSVMPVTSRTSGTTYTNFHCAFCNGDVNDTVIWQPRLEFNNLNSYNDTFRNLTGEYVKDNLEYDPTMGRWGIRLVAEDGIAYYFYAQIYPVLPKEVEGLVRQCRKSLISSCKDDWTNATVQLKCLSYEAAIYEQDLTENRAYRNPHCAICNYVELSALTCKAPAAKGVIEQRTFNFQSFSILLDFNDAKGGQVGKQDLCSDGEIYDPFQKQCINVVCGFPGYVLRNGECVLAVTTTTTTSTTPTPIIDVPVTPLDRPVIFPTEETTANTSIEPNTTDIEVIPVTELSAGSGPTNDDQYSSRSDNLGDATLSPITTASFYSDNFIKCPKASLTVDKVEALPNGSIYVIPYDKTYDPSHYLFQGDKVLVCAFFFNDTVTETQKFSIAFGYITVVGLSISMLCLILHLITFLIVPDLHNFSTRNLSSLALALFFAYFCFMIGSISTLSNLSCTILAVSAMFFFLVSFFWMNTMSFDVWRTLRLATNELRVSSGKQCKRFLVYSLYSWGAPAAIVSIALVMDNVNGVPDEYKPGFGLGHTCWITERKALLVFFAAPLIAIMLANIGFFVSSAKMILSTTQTTSNYTASSRRNFKLYIRLGMMMGLTWTFGLLAGYLNLETLWYVFVLLNTLQGLFIFVAFTCNRKVRKYLMDKYQAFRKGRQAYRTSSLNSGSGFNSNETFPSTNMSGPRTDSSQLSETKSNSLKSPLTSPLTSTPPHPPTSFKHLQAGMETLY